MSRRAAILILAIGMAAGSALATVARMPGVADPNRARVNWMLKCQGCHRPDAGGGPDGTPPMAGQVARFLSVPGGRDYLGRVPGVATAALPDDQLAELLNWTLLHYDPRHVPADFKPYTTAEMAALRRAPLRTEAAATRARLIAALPSGTP